MPLGSTVPAWYNDNYYINEKVDECNTIKFGAVEGEEFVPWTADSVRDFMAGVNQEASYAPWMGYDNFVSSGNGENCSPNPLFDVMQYVTAKAAQLNSINYDGRNADNNPWTAQAVLDYFNAHNITAWDHFTTAGQFENVNPSNAMDLSDFLANKAKECNDIEFDGRTDWDEQAVLDYYAQNGLNAVMVAVSANDPLVVAVPEAEQVEAPIGITPWGMATTPVDVELTTGVDVMPENAAPINYIGTVANSTVKSTLNQNDQINGGNEADILTVNMDNFWTGFGRDGYVKNVPTIDLNNETANRDLFFNAEKVEGATTYNIDGNISLSNLGEAGITVNLANVDTPSNVNIGFTSEAVKGTSDSVTIGLDNVRIPQPANVDGYLDYRPVTITSQDVENVILDSTGTVENRVNLQNMMEMRTLAVTGDAAVRVSNVTTTLESVDASEATGNVRVNAMAANLVESAALGSGDDSLRVNNIVANAQVNGGDGDDTLVLAGTAGALQLQMSDVETLGVTDGNYNSPRDLSIDAGATTGMNTLGLSGNGVIDYSNPGVMPGPVAGGARNVSLSNFNEGQLTVEATGWNNVLLAANDVPDLTVNVGDGDVKTPDALYGKVIAPDAYSVSVNTTDNNTKAWDAVFDAAVDAGKANNLSLSTAQNSSVTLASGGDLSAVSQVTVGGYDDVTIADATLGQKATGVYVNAQGLVGGTFTSSYVGNSNESNTPATLNFTGSTTGVSDVTVDNTYSRVFIETGANNDTLTLQANGTQYTTSNLAGSLGAGNDTLIIQGGLGVRSDLSGLTGIERIEFAGMTVQQARAFVENPANGIKLGNGLTSANVYGDGGFEDTKENVEGGTNYGNGGETTFKGPLNTTGDTTINGDSASGDAGGAKINFGTGADDLKIEGVKDLTINGGSDTNTITGTPENINGNFTINDTAGTAEDVIDLSGIKAAGAVSIQAPEAGVTTYSVSVAQAASANLNAGDTKDASMAVTGVDGAVSLTAGDNGSTMSVTGTPEVQPDSVAMTAGAGDDKASLTGITAAAEGATPEMTVNLGEGTNSLTVNGANDLTGWNATIKNAPINIADGATLNLGNNWGNLTKSPISATGTGKVVVTADTDLSGVSVPVTAPIDVASGKFVTIGDNFGAENGITGNITGAGGVQIAEGKTVDLSAEGAPDITATGGLQMAKNSTLVVDDTLLAVSNAEGATGTTLEVKGADVDAGTTAVDVDTVEVAEGAKVSVDLANYNQEGKFDPSAITGAGTLAFTATAADTVPMGEGDPTLSVKTINLGENVTLDATTALFTGMAAIAGSAITGDGTIKLGSDLTVATAPAINVTNVNVDTHNLTVAASAFGTGETATFAATNITGADGGTLTINGSGDANLSAVKVAAAVDLSIGDGVTVKVGGDFGDATKSVASTDITGDGTLEFTANATAFATGSTIATNIKVDEGATLTLGDGWDGSYDKQISGPGAVQNGDGKAWDLSGDNALDFIGSDLALKIVTGGAGIELGEVEATNTFKITGDGDVKVDLSADAGETANLSGITANASSSFTGSFGVELGIKDTVTLSDNATEAITITGSDLSAFTDAADALTVNGFGTGDTVKLDGALDSYDFDTTKVVASDSTGAVAAADNKIYGLTGFTGDVTTTSIGELFGANKAFGALSAAVSVLLAIDGETSTSLYSVTTSSSAVTGVQLIGTFNGMDITAANADTIFVS